MLFACSEAPPPAERTVKPVRILEVGHSALASREFFGTAEASRTADLSFRFGGKLTELPVAQGDRVDAGAVIARLDSREWAARERQTASELDAARAVLAQMRRGAREEDVQRLKAAVAARNAEVNEATAQFDRMEQLLAERAVSRVERDKARLALEVAKSSAAAAELELKAAETGARAEEIEAQEAAIRGLESRLQEARDNLKDTVLLAPFAGVIARTHASQFEDIQANEPVATLQNLSQIDVVINVTEAEFGRGQDVEPDPEFRNRTVAFAEFPALQNRRFPLRVKEFQTQADPSTQTYKVILQMEQGPNFPVKPGMNAVVRGDGSDGREGEENFVVPVSAVWGDAESEKSVWVIDPAKSTVSRRSVSCGEIMGDSIVITEGLSAGERIAVTAANLLREGMQVEPMKDLGAL
jgi:RND family efflux transporter MFP subunit